ncbi:MAG: dinitrogenase iron-molybdenum cofactor [Propionibacteriaceae bacterium]|nr:dinitrogenase iron-molybdenum cofactor [Propionibacteriaceae bacterium]
MIVGVNLDGNLVGGGLGRAHAMAVADVQDGRIVSWKEEVVGWDISHDEASSHGAHHARIVTFMRENNVQAVVTGHIGPPMAHTLDLMGIALVVGVEGPAQGAAIAAAAT